MQVGEGVQLPRREASLEHTRGEAKQDVPGGPSKNKSDVGSRVLPGEKRADQEVAVDEGSDS